MLLEDLRMSDSAGQLLSFKEATGLVAAICDPRALKDISKTREGKGQAEAQCGMRRDQRRWEGGWCDRCRQGM